MRGGDSGYPLRLWRCRSAGAVRPNVSRSRRNEWCERGTYSGPRGPDTVEHVRPEGDGDEEIFGVADAHYVARFILREPVCAGVYSGCLRSARFQYEMDHLD